MYAKFTELIARLITQHTQQMLEEAEYVHVFMENIYILADVLGFYIPNIGINYYM